MADALYGFLQLFGYGHPLHPVIVHLVIGPVIAALLFYLAAWLFKKPALYRTARHLTVLSLIMWFPAVTMGVLDWLHFYGGSFSMADILYKSVGAGLLLLLLLGNIFLFKKIKPESQVHLVLYLAAAITVGFIGIMGGEIVYGGQKKQPAPVAAAAAQTSPDGFKHVSFEGYSVDWKIEGTLVHFRLSYATKGWIGIGFGKSATMQDAHIIIGYVADGKTVVEDHFGYSGHSHAPESKVGGKSTVSEISGKQEANLTTLAWTMPLNTGNPKDLVLTPGDRVTVILAHGDDDSQDVTSYHGPDGRTTTQITF